MGLLKFTKEGIFCPQAGIYIDPWRRVDKALITHGHSDHARRGHKHYLCTHAAKPIIQHRLGKIHCDSIDFRKTLSINGVKISFHPAGHIVGSAQIRLEHKGEVWVVSGDYKLQDDGLSEPFEPIRCHHFITESTFGLPIYKWKSNEEVSSEINNWWANNKRIGKISILQGYSLGKAQRLLFNLDQSIGRIFTNDAVEKINSILRHQGIPLPPSTEISTGIRPKDLIGNMIITSSTASLSQLLEQESFSLASASGWMMLRKMRKSRNVDRAFVVSDHADWDGLLTAIRATEAENIYVTHGSTKILTRYLKESGWNAQIVATEFEGEPSQDV